MRLRPASAAGALLGALALSGQAVATPPQPPTPDRMLVRGSEFDIVLSKQRVRPGRVIVQFVNDGEDPHDLRLQLAGSGAEFGVGEIAPGEYENLDARLRKSSTYALYCSLPGHREAGMDATLRTRKRR